MKSISVWFLPLLGFLIFHRTRNILSYECSGQNVCPGFNKNPSSIDVPKQIHKAHNYNQKSITSNIAKSLRMLFIVNYNKAQTVGTFLYKRRYTTISSNLEDLPLNQEVKSMPSTCTCTMSKDSLSTGKHISEAFLTTCYNITVTDPISVTKKHDITHNTMHNITHNITHDVTKKTKKDKINVTHQPTLINCKSIKDEDYEDYQSKEHTSQSNLPTHAFIQTNLPTYVTAKKNPTVKHTKPKTTKAAKKTHKHPTTLHVCPSSISETTTMTTSQVNEKISFSNCTTKPSITCPPCPNCMTKTSISCPPCPNCYPSSINTIKSSNVDVSTSSTEKSTQVLESTKNCFTTIPVQFQKKITPLNDSMCLMCSKPVLPIHTLIKTKPSKKQRSKSSKKHTKPMVTKCPQHTITTDCY